MAVAEYTVNGNRVAVRGFEVPKRAGELKYWYRAVHKAMPSVPPFEPRFLVNADITVETIILDWVTDGSDRHRLIIARKRRLF